MRFAIKKWADVLQIISGRNQKEVLDPTGSYPIYGSGGIMGYANQYLCEAGTTIVGRKGTIDNPIFVNERFWNVDTAFGVSPGEQLNPRYLYFFCRHFNFKQLDKSTTIPSLAKRDLLSIEMPVPPLVEQKRIVEKIEELFSELDSGVETLKMIKSKVDRYKYSVIDSVLPSENQKSIADCIKEMGQGWSPKCERVNVVDDDNWAVIKTTAVQPCKFLFDENKALPSSLAPRERHEIMAGDILITRAGPKSRCGVCCMVRKTKRRLLNCDKVYRLRLHEDIVLPQYLEYVLNSPAFIQEINLCKTGGNDSGLNLTQDRFLSIRIPVPSIKKQEEIVSEIESRRSVCDSIEKTVDAALQQADALRQSILKKAFEGKL